MKKAKSWLVVVVACAPLFSSSCRFDNLARETRDAAVDGFSDAVRDVVFDLSIGFLAPEEEAE